MAKVQYQTLQELHHAKPVQYAWVEDITWCPGMHSFVNIAGAAGVHPEVERKHHVPIAVVWVQFGERMRFALTK